MTRSSLNASNQSTVYNVINYDEFIAPLDILYSMTGMYILIGDIPRIQGWVFYLPVSVRDFPSLLNSLLPYVLSNNLGLKIPVNKVIHENIREGVLGAEFWGKVICVYSKSQNNNISILAKDLISITSHLKGSVMPGSYLGGLVYTRYASFEEIVTPEGSFIINSVGEFVKEEYGFPYVLPNWVSWPFESITPNIITTSNNLLNNKYFIINIIRDTAKGRIIMAITRKNIFQVKKVLIKEGRPGVFADDHDRDIVNRLNWQRELHTSLSKKIKIPHFIDFFEQDRNCYLVIDYIDGMRFEDYLDLMFQFESFASLDTKKKLLLVKNIIQIIDVIEQLHQSNIVHRDISIGNFMVGKSGEIILIDLELAYDLKNKIPFPPFQMGTPGYISPEQRNIDLLPDFSNDVYSIGALMIVILTHLAPRKFNFTDPFVLAQNIDFFLSDQYLTRMIMSCVALDPKSRPSLKNIKEELQNYSKIYKEDFSNNSGFEREDIVYIIEQSISSLCSQLMLNIDGYWLSQINEEADLRNVLIGFSKGIGGIIFLLSNLKSYGFCIERILPQFLNNWHFVQSHFLFAEAEVPGGLYNGSFGLAVSIANAMDTELLSLNEENQKYIYNCLFNIPDGLDLADGMAGYGIALIQCNKYLDPQFFAERIILLSSRILELQDKNGGWSFQNSGKGEKYPLSKNLENGVSGIIIFLLECCRISHDITLINKTKLALNWLGRKRKVQGQKISSAYIENISVGFAFLKAYEVLKEDVYRIRCEDILSSLPKNMVNSDYSFNRGLVGIGMFYLEYYKVIKNVKILDRAKWIIEVFRHTVIQVDENAYWVQGHSSLPSADLLEGNGGIVYFFLQYLKLIDSEHTIDNSL